MNLSLLQNFKDTDFHINPFPHIIIHDALPNNIYEKLKNSAPINLIPNIQEDNVRGNIHHDQMKDNFKNKMFYDFLNYHNSVEYYEEFISIFEDHLKKLYPNLIERTRLLIKKKQFLKLTSENSKKENFMTFNSTYSYNTPVKSSSHIIGPHLDHYDKINFGLYYLRLDEDKSEGGDLVIYKWKNGYNDFKKKKYYLY